MLSTTGRNGLKAVLRRRSNGSCKHKPAPIDGLGSKRTVGAVPDGHAKPKCAGRRQVRRSGQHRRARHGAADPLEEWVLAGDPAAAAKLRARADRGDRGDLEAIYASWCQYDSPGADIIADDGQRGHYQRSQTLSRGSAKCDMCWKAGANPNVQEPTCASPPK